MKITIQKDNGDVSEFEIEEGPGNRQPIINRAMHKIIVGQELQTNRFIKNIKHTKKVKK